MKLELRYSYAKSQKTEILLSQQNLKAIGGIYYLSKDRICQSDRRYVVNQAIKQRKAKKKNNIINVKVAIACPFMFEVEEYASTAGVFPILVKRLSLV